MQARILLVEDDTQSRHLLARGLEQAGYHVTQAADGSSAIQSLEQQAFAVVLSDLVLGTVSGLDVLQAARKRPYRPVVILLTGHGSLDTALNALRNDAFDYLLKPCLPATLLETVSRAVQHHSAEQHLREATVMLFGAPDDSSVPAGQSEVFRIGELQIGNSRSNVAFRGKIIHLTPIEYQILLYLAANQGQTCRYTDIARRTHQIDMSSIEAQNLLRPHITHLRRKLAPGYLHNERGIGYRLINPGMAPPTPMDDC
jgi:two-component system, OmpR family, response regulator